MAQIAEKLAEMADNLSDYVYLPIIDAKKLVNMKVNLFAKICEIGLPRRSKGTDYCLILKIVDLSCSAQALSVNFFAVKKEDLPSVKSAGDIICLHQVEMKIHNGDVYFLFKKRFSSFALFDGKINMGLNPYQTSASYRATDCASELLAQLRTLSPEQSDDAETDYEKVAYATLMDSITNSQVVHMCKCVVRVVASCPWRGEDLRSPVDGHYRIRLTLEDPTARVHAYIVDENGVKFFGGNLGPDDLTKKMMKLLGIKEPNREESEPVSRNPPWITCCLISYYLDENDQWGSRRYRIYGTRLLDWNLQHQERICNH